MAINFLLILLVYYYYFLNLPFSCFMLLYAVKPYEQAIPTAVAVGEVKLLLHGARTQDFNSGGKIKNKSNLKNFNQYWLQNKYEFM